MLLSLWFLLTLVGLAVLVIAGLGWLEVRRRRRRRAGSVGALRAWSARALSGVVVVALAVACVADYENRAYQYIPNFDALLGHPSPDFRTGGLAIVNHWEHHPGGAPHGHGVDVAVSLPGKRSHIRRVAYVYLPPGYFDAGHRHRRYPVLYLIHGSPGVAVDWVRGAQVDRTMDHLVAVRRIQPFILVMPDANGGYGRDLECQDAFHGPADQTYLATDVVGWIDRHFRTLADRGHRAIGGLSTGGYCAVNLAFRHQHTFSAAVSHSGSGQPDHSRYTGDLFHGRGDVQAANTPVRYLRQLPVTAPMAVYLDSGRADRWALPRTRRLDAVLLARHLPATFHTVDGEHHSFDSWRRNANLSLPWLSHWFAHHQATTVTDVVREPRADYLPALPKKYHRRHRGHQHGAHGVSGHNIEPPPPPVAPSTTGPPPAVEMGGRDSPVSTSLPQPTTPTRGVDRPD